MNVLVRLDLGRARHHFGLLEQRFQTSEDNRKDLERDLKEARELAIRQERTVEDERTIARYFLTFLHQHNNTFS